MNTYGSKSSEDHKHGRLRERRTQSSSELSRARTDRRARRIVVSGGIVLVAWLLVGMSATAQEAAPRKLGGELKVNTYTPGFQLNAAIASDPVGNFVVVWQGPEIHMQRFDALGPVDGEDTVNSYTTDLQGQPTVAADGDGDFVIAWNSRGPEGTGTYGIAAQRFDALGGRRGDEFLVNTYFPYSQSRPDVGRAVGGEFVVAWQGYRLGYEDDVFGQRFDASGNFVGGEFRPNASRTNDQRAPAVAVTDSGAFTVVWSTNITSVFFRQFDSNGYPLISGDTIVNATPSGYHFNADVGISSAGNFVVAWNRGFDGDGYGVYMRRFDATGYPLSGNDDELVNTHIADAQFRPAIDVNGPGDFVIVWESRYQDGDGNGVFGQVFDAVGNRVGDEFQVNATTADDQDFPGVAIDEAGNFVVVWRSYNPAPSYNDIYLQRFLGPCRSELPLTENEWHLISLPCLPPAGGETVQAVFGDDLPLNGYGGSWIVFERDAATNQYVQLSLTDSLEMGRGYWIFTILTNRTIDVEGSNADYSCAPGSFFAAKGGCHVSPVLTGAGSGDCGDLVNLPGRFNMLGHPLTREISWAGTRFHDGSTEYTVQDAHTQNIASDQIWTWNGSAYQAGDACTMGMDASLGEWDGFWVHACNPTNPLTLRIGGSETTSCTAPPPPPGAEPESLVDGTVRESRGPDQGGGGGEGKKKENRDWYLRLVASADGLSDPGNVLGELSTATVGYDRHDLIELQPFGTNWLTIVFPHLDWGSSSSEWFTSDYHAHDDPRTWSFEVRSNQSRTVTLTWELTGDPKLVEKLERKMELVDEVSGARIPASDGVYVFTQSGTEHPFTWREAKGGPPRR